MISVEQIRGARGLLGWTQLDLARNCGLSKTVMNNLERQLVTPRLRTLETIKRKLEEHGIEFSGAYGVNLCNDIFKVNIYEGKDSFPRYMQDIIDKVKGTNIEPVHFNVDDQIVLNQGYEDIYFQYFSDLRRYGIHERVLTREGDRVRYAPYDTSTYKWMPKDLFSQNGYSIYGDTYSIFIYGKTNRVINIQNPMVAEIHMRQFDAAWKISKNMPKVEPRYNSYAVNNKKGASK